MTNRQGKGDKHIQRIKDKDREKEKQKIAES